MSSPSDTPNIHIAGVPLCFPHTPYRAQVALMHAVVTAAKREENALVESPTGTGKSLALLCSSLAVQQHLSNEHEKRLAEKAAARKEKEKEEEEKKRKKAIGENDNNDDNKKGMEIESKDDSGNDVTKKKRFSSGSSSTTTKPITPTPTSSRSNGGRGRRGLKKEEQNITQQGENLNITKKKEEEEEEELIQSFFEYSNLGNQIQDSDDDDFQPVQRKLPDVSWQNPVRQQRKRTTNERPEEEPENAFMLHPRRDNPLDGPTNSNPDDDDPQPTTAKTKPCKPIPRIFYATRTHTQVTQVIRELRKTIYRPPLSILASRREYCVNDPVRKQAGRDDACKRLVAEQACVWYRSSSQLATHSEIRSSAWDIEELTTLGRNVHGCPYYASHELYQEARLILCPYSFLIDPVVRGARGIDLSGDIVILDEAHNMENYARDAASFSVDVSVIRRGIDEIDTIVLTTTRRRREGQGKGSVRELLLAYQCVKRLFIALVELVEIILDKDDRVRTLSQGGAVDYDSGGFNGAGENKVLERQAMLTTLSEAGINLAEVKRWREAYDFVMSFGDGKEEGRFQRMGFHQGPVIAMHDEGGGESQRVVDGDYDDGGYSLGGHGHGDDSSGRRRRQGNNSSSSRGGYGHGYGGGDVLSNSFHHDEYGDDDGTQSSDWRRRVKRRGRFSSSSSSSMGDYNKSHHRRHGRNPNNDDDNDNDDNNEDTTTWQVKSLSIAISALTTLHYVFCHDNDYTLVVCRKSTNMITSVTLSLHCLNAAVSFRDISSRARCVVVTSGTLSPMQSFAGELGTTFCIEKSLPHVVDVRRQVYVGVIGQGRSGVRMDATFHGSARFEFQDALGELLVEVAGIVKGGVLVFFPSYRLVEVLCKRWRMTGVWARLHLVKKKVLREPGQRGEEFDSVVAEYNRLVSGSGNGNGNEGEDEGEGEGEEYEENNNNNSGYGSEIEHFISNHHHHHHRHQQLTTNNNSNNSNMNNETSRNGAILLAVCRGKLSEGIDFRDDACRAVIIVGIPFPNKNDVVIAHKRQWNDRSRNNARLEKRPLQVQCGAAWYEMQAFRALNQALGRAVRHRYDYGAILLVDARFLQAKVLGQLSKWTREGVVNHTGGGGRGGGEYGGTMRGLEDFYRNVHGHLAELAEERNHGSRK